MRRTIVCLCLLLLPTVTALAESATPSEEAALQAYREGAFSRAVELYRNALSETDDPAHRARLHVNIAWTLFALGRENEVNTHLRAALVEDPDLTLMPDYYTQEFLDLFEAARTYDSRRGAAPTGSPTPDLEATVASIHQHLESGQDLEGALADVKALIEAHPEDARLQPLRAEILRRLGRTEEAQQALDAHGAGAEQTPTPTDNLSIPDLILRANRYLDEGDVQTAFDLLREAVSRQPSNVAALELMAEAALRSARWQDAEFALKSALSLQPDNLNLQLRLGSVYLAKGDASAARDIFRQLTESYPHSDRAWAALGLLDARLSNQDRAQDELERALDENPLLPEVQLTYGELLLARGEFEAALSALQAADNLLQNDPQLEARLGQTYLAMGRDEAALKRLRAAVNGGFEPPDVQRALALALVVNGDNAEAERLLGHVTTDRQGELAIIRGLLLLEQGVPAEAAKVLRPVAEQRPSDPAVLNLLAVALYRQADYEGAVVLLRRATDLVPDDPTVGANLAHATAAQTALQLEAHATAVQQLPAS